ncbi:DJ-1/PfpI family protein [Rhodococcus sp. X156]|uniref:DJ-1/PfpI family protein n=1 Tax=Rhodococcus sp. X156 TaxID=2499145 RepID=UPI000FD6F089|nr:DJ-1/PfpI family protein [Rhodococcus sp. X156]
MPRTIAFLVAPEGAEQEDVLACTQAVLDAGGVPRLLSTLEPGAGVRALDDLERGLELEVDVSVEQAVLGDYDGLVLPGGLVGADALRLQSSAVELVRDWVGEGRPVAAVGHAPWLLVEAHVAGGKTMTSTPSIATDLVNAGAQWVDGEVQVCPADGWVLVTSRGSADLPAFTTAMLRAFGLERS